MAKPATSASARKRPRSEEAYARACLALPGGVNSPARAFGGVGGQPIFIARGEGPYLFDLDGNRYLDYVGSWGPLILGHAHPRLVAALEAQARRLAVPSRAYYNDQLPFLLKRLCEITGQDPAHAVLLDERLGGLRRVVVVPERDPSPAGQPPEPWEKADHTPPTVTETSYCRQDSRRQAEILYPDRAPNDAIGQPRISD